MKVFLVLALLHSIASASDAGCMQQQEQDEVSLLQSMSSVRHGGQRPESDEEGSAPAILEAAHSKAEPREDSAAAILEAADSEAQEESKDDDNTVQPGSTESEYDTVLNAKKHVYEADMEAHKEVYKKTLDAVTDAYKHKVDKKNEVVKKVYGGAPAAAAAAGEVGAVDPNAAIR